MMKNKQVKMDVSLQYIIAVLLVGASTIHCKVKEYPISETSNNTHFISEHGKLAIPMGLFFVAGFFGVHDADPLRAKNQFCGKLNRESLIQIEALRFAFNRLVEVKDLFYGMPLDYLIVDSCRNLGTLRRTLTYATWNLYYVAIIGPPTSDEAVNLATFFRVYRPALISPSVSNAGFDDRIEHDNFFRTVPSDTYQVQAMIDIFVHFNWTYISIVNSFGRYGSRAAVDFTAAAAKRGICVAQWIQLTRYVTTADFAAVLAKLSSDKYMNIVLLFTGKADTKSLLQAARHNKRFTWVSSTSWTPTKEFVKGAEDTAKGALILHYSGLEDKKFKQYFLNLTLSNNNYTWFREFWRDTFNCSTTLTNTSRPRCTGKEKLEEDMLDWKYMSIKPVINAVEAIACALRFTMFEQCPNRSSTAACAAKNFWSTVLFTEIGQHLRSGNTTCELLNDSVSLNQRGFLHRDIIILNYDGAKYKEIGTWRYNESTKASSLNLSVENITWKKNEIPISICSKPCKAGEIQIADTTRPKCCFTCETCPSNTIITNNTCQWCGLYELADRAKMVCKKMPVVHIAMKDPLSLITIAALGIGLLLTSFTLALFLKNRHLRMVKASSRELSIFILMALYLCFICPFAYLVEPSNVACGTQRFIIGLSLTGCYTPLMLKTNRIYRIFKGAQAMIEKPPLVSPRSQILVCTGLLGVQLLLGIMWVVAEPPGIDLILIENNTKVAEICRSDPFNFILNLLPCFIVMAICTVYAFQTRRFPSNFNEAQSIGITMYISCFLWGIFIPLILVLESKGRNVFRQTYIVANFTTIIGLVTLAGLFGPKVKRLLCIAGSAEPKVEQFSRRQKETTASAVANFTEELKTIPESESMDTVAKKDD